MSDQCQSCGSYQNLKICALCAASLICDRCRGHHEFGCKEAQEKKARGQGKTVREIGRSDVVIPPMAGRQIQSPEATRPGNMNPGIGETRQLSVSARLPEPIKVASQIQDPVDETAQNEAFNAAMDVARQLQIDIAASMIGAEVVLPAGPEPDVDEINMQIAEAVAADDGMPLPNFEEIDAVIAEAEQAAASSTNEN
jgi:hypothetical protein